MNQHWQSDEGRLLALLADEATFGLNDSERGELDALLPRYPQYGRECMHHTAALVHLATFTGPVDSLPGTLEEKIRNDAFRFLLRPPEAQDGHFSPA